MTPSMSTDIYSNSTYLQHNPDWHLEDTGWKADLIAGILEKNKVDWATGTEVGCGSGGIVEALAKRYRDRRLFGYDTSADASRLWGRINEPNATYRNADFLAEGVDSDLIMLIDVFEHVEDYMGFLRKLRAKGKWFVFHIPLDLHVSGLLRGGQMVSRKEVGHLHYFSQQTAAATLRDTGYEIVDQRLTDLAVQTNKSRMALRTKLLNPVRQAMATVAPETTALLLGGYSLLTLCR
jgi:hypothetical protein